MPAIAGRNGVVYIGVAGAATVVTLAKAWSLTLDRDMDNINVFGDLYQKQLPVMGKWSGSFEGLLDTTQTTPFDAAALNFLALTNNSPMNMYLYPTAATTTAYYYGTVWPKIDIKVSNTAIESYTQDFDGDGPLSYH